VTTDRFVAIHGHFYQPPRENPWLEAVEVQDSAAPYHDWNERVTAECYSPNTAARRVGHDNRILDIVNNFEKISFNVGPPPVLWLERARRRSTAASWRATGAALRPGGHGNAIAQVYNHMILPLARGARARRSCGGAGIFRGGPGGTPRVCGCRADARGARGGWDRVHHPGAPGLAHPRVGRKSTTRRPESAYLWRGSGARLTVFFYDGRSAIAFGNALERGENLVARLKGGFVEIAREPSSSTARRWRVLPATKFGDMAPAAIAQIEAKGSAVLTNYGAFLAKHPPTYEVEIRERTSWSCAHGVERWRSDCGCRTRADWHQRWRAPLREALDWLRDQIDTFYESRASAFLKDPWQARDAYIDVILDRTPDGLATWLARHRRALLDADAQVATRGLLEMQRNRLLMYTSCGWFFDEISSLEPTQNLKYAAMALQYLSDLGGGNLEDEFVRRLEAAPSNVPALASGGQVYRSQIAPAAVDLRRVVAHYAISSLFADYPDEAPVYSWRVHRLDDSGDAYDGSRLKVGRVRVASEITGETRDLQYTVLHFGGHDFSCGIRLYENNGRYESMKADLLRRYAQRSTAEIVRALDERFPEGLFSLTHLFLEQRRHVLASVMRAVLDKHEQTYRLVWEESRKVVRYLRQADAPIPEVLRITAKHVLEEELVAELRRTGDAADNPRTSLRSGRGGALAGPRA
jgi:hypothetical protein